MIDKYIATDEFTNSNGIPSTYLNSITPYEQVSQLITYVNSLWEQYTNLTTSNSTLEQSYENVIKELQKMQLDFQKYTTGANVLDGSISFKKLDNTIFTQINDYIKSYMYDMHKFVDFGLTSDGHFCADIPTTWQDITFSTNTTGNLILEF